MKKTFLAAAIAALALAACKGTLPSVASGSSPETQPVDAPPAPAAPVAFELRDFLLERSTTSFGGARYSGRGTLATKDPRLSSGTFIVYLKCRQEHEGDEEAMYIVTVRDGFGTVTVSTYQTSDEEKNEKVRFYDWSVVGYVALQPGTIEASNSAAGTAPPAA